MFFSTNSQLVAIKKVRIPEDDNLVSPIHEVKMLESLQHPNIIRIFDSFFEKKKIYIVMEYCDNGIFNVNQGIFFKEF